MQGVIFTKEVLLVVSILGVLFWQTVLGTDPLKILVVCSHQVVEHISTLVEELG